MEMTPETVSPDRQEADAIIQKLSSTLGQPAATTLCHVHSEALIWIVRRMDLNGHGAGLTPRMQFLVALAKSSPISMIAIAIMFVAWVWAKANGVHLVGI